MSAIAPVVRILAHVGTAGVFRDAGPLHQRRSRLEAAARTMPRPRGVRVTRDVLAGRPALRARPRDAAADAAVLYLHGGSYVAGSPTTHANIGARLARAAGCEVWLLDYRLAPEHPFPAAHDDAVAAATSLRRAGVARLAVAGDSAGGGIALAATTTLGDSPFTSPAALLLLSPWLDLTLSAGSVLDLLEDEVVLDPATIAHDARAYAGGRALTDPGVSPLFADLSRLPPTLVQVGGRDVLLADGRRLAEAATRHTDTVELQLWPAMWHVWHAGAPLLPEANAAIRDAGAWLRPRLAPSRHTTSHTDPRRSR